VPGLLADQQFGLIANAPIYAVAIAGLVVLARQRLRLSIEIAAIFFSYLLAVASYRMWWGGHSAPARFLVAVLPLLAAPLAVAWSRGSAGRRALMLVLLVISVVLVVTRVSVDHGALLYNDRDGYDLLLDWANRSVNLPLAFPSLHRDVVPDARGDIAIWVLVTAACAATGMVVARRAGQEWTCMSAALAVAVMIASTLVWRGASDSVTENTSALALLQRWPAAPITMGWQSSPFTSTAADLVPTRLILGSVNRGARVTRAPLFTGPFVPGGQYELLVEGQRPSGHLTVTVGRTPQVLETITFDETPSGAGGPLLALPLQVHSLTIAGDDAARASVGALRLRPRHVGNADGATPALARRASRYGPIRVFFLDDNTFMEPPGFWTRGLAATTVFVDTEQAGRPPGPPPALRVRAGAVSTTVTLTSREWREKRTLDAGATATLALPPVAAGGWLLRIETDSGFRPAQHDASSQDWRNLGVWVEPGH
jgi:hypothetical protein